MQARSPDPEPVSRGRGAARAALRAAAAAVLLWLAGPATLHAAPEASAPLWADLREGGNVVLMRHAIAPGGGDPPGFRLEDCATQRNLSEQGRAQARAIGDALRLRRVPVQEILSSQWCRCKETAQLLALGPVREYPVLNSFFSDRSTAAVQTEALRRFVGGRVPEGNLVLVTHQVNITELTGVYPASGELVVLRPDGAGGFSVLGSLRPSN